MKSALSTAIGALALAVLLTVAGLVGENPQAYQFPILIGGVMIVLALFMLADVVMRQREGGGAVEMVEAYSLPLLRLLPAALVMAGYLLLLERLGFYSSAFVAFLAMTSIYARRATFDPRGLATRAAYGVLFVGTLYVLFALVLGAQLPKGALV